MTNAPIPLPPNLGPRRSVAPVFIVLPSVVSGIGVAFILAAVFITAELVSDIFLAVGVLLLWLDFFITMAIVRYNLRSIDRRLRHLEERVDRRRP